MAFGQTVIKAWGLFEQTLVQARRHMSSTVMSRVFASLPFLFEGTLDRAAPGGGSQTIKGQNHAFDGGRQISRNLVFSADIGHGGTNAVGPLGVHSLTVSAGFGVFKDVHETSARLSNTYQFRGYVSPGVDTSETANDAAPIGLENYLIMQVQSLIGLDPIDFRWENVSEGATEILTGGVNSSIITVTNTGLGVFEFFELDFIDVPCIENAYNRFNLQVRVQELTTIRLMSVTCPETRARSAPKSAGTLNLRTETF